eukprot:6141547-Pleurochrysis_carterae.AAC.1
MREPHFEIVGNRACERDLDLGDHDGCVGHDLALLRREWRHHLLCDDAHFEERRGVRQRHEEVLREEGAQRDLCAVRDAEKGEGACQTQRRARRGSGGGGGRGRAGRFVFAFLSAALDARAFESAREESGEGVLVQADCEGAERGRGQRLDARRAEVSTRRTESVVRAEGQRAVQQLQRTAFGVWQGRVGEVQGRSR